MAWQARPPAPAAQALAIPGNAPAADVRRFVGDPSGNVTPACGLACRSDGILKRALDLLAPGGPAGTDAAGPTRP